MSIRSTGLNGSATIVNSDLFNDVETLKVQVTTLSTSELKKTTTQEPPHAHMLKRTCSRP
jgi:hypothetical protein